MKRVARILGGAGLAAGLAQLIATKETLDDL